MTYLKNKLSCSIGILCVVFLLTFCKQEGPEKGIVQKELSAKTITAESNKTKFKTILFFGNSLTAGFGIGLSEAFPALLQYTIDSLHLPYKTINAGLSGETSSGGLTRIDWVLKQPVDVFVLELGANDGLRGLNLKQTKENLQKIIDKVKSKYPEAKLVIAGMQIPPSMGKEYALKFKNIFKDLSQENDATLIPFLLENVAGNPELNQPDGIHPTVEGAKIVSMNVWKVLKDIL